MFYKAAVIAALLVLAGCTNQGQGKEAPPSSTVNQQRDSVELLDLAQILEARGFIMGAVTHYTNADPQGEADFQQGESADGVVVQLVADANGARIKHISKAAVGTWDLVLCGPQYEGEREPTTAADIVLPVIDAFDKQVAAIQAGTASFEPANDGWVSFKSSGNIGCSGWKQPGK